MKRVPSARARGPKILLVVSDTNPGVTRRLEEGAVRVLSRRSARVTTVRVPGAFEIPRAAARFGRAYDGIVALGCVIRGETRHDEIVATASARGLLDVSLRPGYPPVGFGVLWAPDEKAALARARPAGRGGRGPGAHRGEEAARACLAMIEIGA